MTRTALVTIALLSSIATPLVVNATGRTAPEVTTTAAAAPAVSPAAETSTTAPETCRQVKVVYPAYGLPSGATTCAAPQLRR